MPGEIDVYVEAEDSSSKYQGKWYFKSTRWTYTLNHLFKIYDLSLWKFAADILGFDAPLPPMATDFGKHTENFQLEFIIADGSPERSEETLSELIKFVRFKAAYAEFCFIYIGDNIKTDGTRIFDDVTEATLGGSRTGLGKGINGKIGNLDIVNKTEQGFITCRLNFLVCEDLLNW